MKLHPSLIVLKALLAGIPVTGDDGLRLGMSENNQLGMFLHESEDQMYIMDWSVNWFIAYCEKLSEETLIGLAASLVLQKEQNGIQDRRSSP